MNGIWVRSQDGATLALCSRFAVNEIFIVGGGFHLGEYATRERALCVLNDLELAINHPYTRKEPRPVFHLPKE